MSKIWIVISVIFILFLFQGCSSGWDTETIAYRGPNWTSDNKIVFVREKIIWHNWQGWAGEGSEVKRTEISLCEIDNDGNNYEQIGIIYETEGGEGYSPFNVSTSSVGDWVVVGWGRIFVIRRNGTGLVEIGDGSYPDFSPDAAQIVYEKPDEGIWIMDRDGGNDHQIISDADTRYPAWSPDRGRIAYILASNVSSINDSLCISDINGVMIEAFWLRVDDPDWGPSDSNAVSFKNGYFNDGSEGWHHIGIIHLLGGEIDTLNQFRIGDNPKWAPNGSKFIAYDANGYFVINIDGTNKWYLEP